MLTSCAQVRVLCWRHDVPERIITVPLARIDLAAGQSAQYRRTVGDVVYDSMIEVLNVPKGDRFQVITEHPAEDFVYDPDYLVEVARENWSFGNGEAQYATS
jgi:Tautomerase enzyme